MDDLGNRKALTNAELNVFVLHIYKRNKSVVLHLVIQLVRNAKKKIVYIFKCI